MVKKKVAKKAPPSKRTKKAASPKIRARPEKAPAGVPATAEYTSISQKEFIEQYLNGEIAESTLRRWMNKGLIAVDKRERPHRVFIDHPVTKKFLEQREKDESDTAALLSQRIIDLTLADIQDLSSAVIARMESITKIQKMKIQSDTMMGALISRKFVKQFFDQLIAIDNSVLKTLGGSLSTEVAAIFESADNAKILSVQKLIDTEVYKALETKKKKYNSWLEKLGKDD